MGKTGMSATDILLANGYEDVVVFEDFSYDTALVGVSENHAAVYDYFKMIDWLMDDQGWTWEEAAEWIDYNTIRSYPPYGEKPIIMYSLNLEGNDAKIN